MGKSTNRTDNFVHGKIKIGKAKRTRIPGTNEYILGEVSKKELNDWAKAYKEDCVTKIKAK